MRGRSVHARAVDFAADSQALEAFALLLCSSSGLPELTALVHECIRPATDGRVLEVGYAVITSPWVGCGVLTYRSSEERVKSSDILCYVRVSYSGLTTTKQSSLTSLVLDPLESELEAVQILDDLGFGGLSRFVLL